MGKIHLSLVLALLFLLSACAEGRTNGYVQISAAEAKERLAREDGHVLVDVQSVEEYSRRHIPGAICIPLEEIGNDLPAALPDKDQIILVYSGGTAASQQAAKKLAGLGYTHVFEFGGLSQWPYETVKGTEAPVLEFTAAEGTGKYTAHMDDPSIASVTAETSENGGRINYVFTIRGLKPGETRLWIEERSESTGNYDHIYVVSVGEAGNAGVRSLTTEKADALPDHRADLVAKLNGVNYYGGLEDNRSAAVFSEKLSQTPIQDIETLAGEGNRTLTVHLPWDLPIDKSPVNVKPGDLVLTETDRLEFVLEETDLLGVKLGEVTNNTDQTFREQMADSKPVLSFWLEWSE